LGERAVAAEDDLHADGTDERREDEGDEEEAGEDFIQGEGVADADEGEGEGEEQGEERYEDGNDGGVAEAVEKGGVLKDEEKIVEGECAIGTGEAGFDDLKDGPEEEDREEEVEEGGGEAMEELGLVFRPTLGARGVR